MKKILIFTFFLSLISQSFCISINQIADIAGSFLKGTAQVSASIPFAVYFSLIGLNKWQSFKSGDKARLSNMIKNAPLLFVPCYALTCLSNTLSGASLILRNQSIFEVPLKNLSPSSLLQGISVGCALFASMTYLITKLDINRLKQNEKYQECVNKLIIVGLAATGILSSLAGVAGLAEWAFARSIA